MAAQYTTGPLGPLPGAEKRSPTEALAYRFILPAALVMGVITVYPLLYGIWMAFTNFGPQHIRHQNPRFVGLQNFVDIVTQAQYLDFSFMRILGFNLLWTVINVAFHVALGVGLAMLLNLDGMRGKRVYRALLILPWAVPTYVTSLTWRNMFDYDYGAVNLLLKGWGVVGPDWFKSFWTAFGAVLTTNIWLGFPFMMMVAAAGLIAIPRDYYEAAALDGAGRWGRFVNVTLPGLRPTMIPAIILGFVWTFNQFNVLYFVSRGDPLGQTEILITQAYKLVDPMGLYGVASAFALIIFFILLGFTVVQLRVLKAVGEGAR
ncbi:MAG: sugar ABC transporter permease [Candidatus Sericytochromatia bacterium]|nr:sugar ABC transporter permease [Candidatus Tanganyikabacteria bacterium]